MKSDKKRGRHAACICVSVLIATFFLFPVYWMIITSFKVPGEIFAYPPTFFPKEITVRGYEFQLRAGSQLPMQGSLLNSFIIGLCTVVVTVFFAVSSAYGIARFKLKFGRIVFLGFMLVQMLPDVVFLSPLFVMFRGMKMIDTFLAPVIFTAIFSVPFCVIILRPYFLSIPKEIEEAGRLDGCNNAGLLMCVVIPMVFPGIAVVTAISFIFGWGNLMGPLTFLRSERLFPLTVTMYKAVSEYGIDWNRLMAYGVVLSVPILVLFLALQRYIVFGLTEGAVKG